MNLCRRCRPPPPPAPAPAHNICPATTTTTLDSESPSTAIYGCKFCTNAHAYLPSSYKFILYSQIKMLFSRTLSPTLTPLVPHWTNGPDLTEFIPIIHKKLLFASVCLCVSGRMYLVYVFPFHICVHQQINLPSSTGWMVLVVRSVQPFSTTTHRPFLLRSVGWSCPHSPTSTSSFVSLLLSCRPSHSALLILLLLLNIVPVPK